MSEMHPYRVLVALSSMNQTEAWIRLAGDLLQDSGEIHLHGLVTIAEGTSLSEGAIPARQWRDHLGKLAKDDPRVDDAVVVHVDYRPMERVLGTLHAEMFDLLLVDWQGPATLTGGVGTDDILRQAACDVVLICGASWAEAGDVLLSLRGGPNLSLGVQVAKALSAGAPITLFHAADSRRPAPDFHRLLAADPQIQRTVTAISDIAGSIVREAAGHKVLVLGATFRHPEANASASGPVIQRIYNETQMPLALVRAWHPETLEFHTPRRRRFSEESLSTRTDRWFAENTFHSHEFADLDELLARKARQGLSISVALPALNEEATVGEVIRTLKTRLMDEAPLVDEIVLIDSDSTDNTAAIAEAEGIPVYRHSEILPELGSQRGKGEALWKSLYVLNGDIVAWVDTDITNIHPRFIYGLLGPLLARPQLQFVKGFYQRPIKVDDKMQAYGGGRVTELVARPLLNLFYPELSGIVQPLSGEYAGRRAALEQLPFFSGYGVETGMLIDLHSRFGLDAIAQTDLEMRVHHNQPLVGLSKMSFAILQVFIARLEQNYGVHLLDKANHSMKLIVQEPERFALEIAEIGDVERPPMLTIPAYQAKFGRGREADPVTPPEAQSG